METKDTYEGSNISSDNVKLKLRADTKENQKREKQRVLGHKRKTVNFDGVDTSQVTQREVKDVAQRLVKKDREKQKMLVTLCRAFTQDETHIDTFLQVENSLSSVIGILTGQNSELQLVAACCLTNMATGSHEQIARVLSAAGPYLVTFLQSGRGELQDQCCWAIGNIAGDCQKCRKVLVAQGALPQLVKLFHYSSEACRSAAFALSNVAQGGESLCRILADHGIFSDPECHFGQTCKEHVDVTTEVAWMYFHIVSSFRASTREINIFSGKIAAFLVLCAKDFPVPEVLTPLIRIVGNLACDDDCRQAMTKVDGLQQALKILLDAGYFHLRKETLWTLSNLTVEVSFVESMAESGLASSLLTHMLSASSVLKELLHCLCNMASHDQSACKSWMIEQNVVSLVLPHLRNFDQECVKLGLHLISILLYDPVSQCICFPGGNEATLGDLRFHSNAEIQSIACTLLSHSAQMNKGLN